MRACSQGGVAVDGAGFEVPPHLLSMLEEVSFEGSDPLQLLVGSLRGSNAGFGGNLLRGQGSAAHRQSWWRVWHSAGAICIDRIRNRIRDLESTIACQRAGVTPRPRLQLEGMMDEGDLMAFYDMSREVLARSMP
jgi:hypothetical protein